MIVVAYDVIVVAYDDRVVLGGPFGTPDELRAFCATLVRRPGRRLTAYVLDKPPEMYQVVGGVVVSTGTRH